MTDQSPIGILLCTKKNHDMVQYALAVMVNQLFVSRYQLQLPPASEMEDFLRLALAELEPVDSAEARRFGVRVLNASLPKRKGLLHN